MNTLQNALKQVFPKEIKRIAKEERREHFKKKAARGRFLMAAASTYVLDGFPDLALKELRKDRYACAYSLIQGTRRDVREGFKELEKMEGLLVYQVGKLEDVCEHSSARKQACQPQ